MASLGKEGEQAVKDYLALRSQVACAKACTMTKTAWHSSTGTMSLSVYEEPHVLDSSGDCNGCFCGAKMCPPYSPSKGSSAPLFTIVCSGHKSDCAGDCTYQGNQLHWGW